ncbi:MAG: trypsin-like peptidase domain-containing protein [Clostridia bacterium]|nr:trypsin-like peptidase domain-containing protein [Clostridia bacterium]
MYERKEPTDQNQKHDVGKSLDPSAESETLQTAEYVFSRGRARETKPSPRKGARFLYALLACVLCSAIAFGAGFGGAFLALQLDEEDPVYAPPANNDLHHPNPDEIIEEDTEPDPSIYGSAGEDAFAVSGVARLVQNSVVVIEATIEGSSLMGIPVTATSSGSGVIIAEEGYIVTCNHVVADATSIVVTLNSGARYEAVIAGYDTRSDLAVIRIEPKEKLTAAKHGTSAHLVVGEQVVAVGNPLGTLGGTVTDGIISSTARDIVMADGNEMTLLQTNAAINQGNSGGGLFNLDGQLIGIVNAKYSAEGVEGLAFAIPSDYALVIEKDLIQYGYVRGIPDAGLETIDITVDNYRQYYPYFPVEELGVYVVNSAFCKDLVSKDRILEINGVTIISSRQIEEIIAKCKVGDTVTVLASREGDTFTVSFLLQEYVPG